MTGRGIDQILRHPVTPKIYEGYVRDARDYIELAERANGKIPRDVSDEYIWGDALDIWREKKADIKIVNLETSITTHEEYMPDKGINYRMHPNNASIFSVANIDVCTLANNHILDWGYQGLAESVRTLKKIGIKHSGAGPTLKEAQAPAICEAKGYRVLVFSMCFESSGVPFEWEARDHTSGVFLLHDLTDSSVKEVSSVVNQYKERGDIAIASIHWGSNWGYDISMGQRSFAHSLIDQAGIDIVHGHSSHHPRPIEIYKGHPILYGCGDFINDYEGIGGYETFRDDLSLMYFVSYEPNPFKLTKLELICMQINKFRLQRASVEDVKWILYTLNRESRAFDTKFELSKENSIIL